MEGFEPKPQTVPVEAGPQGGDTAAAVEELLKNEGVPPAHVEPLRREASGLMTRLGNSPLARKIYFGAAALSLMAAKGEFSPREAEAQTRQVQSAGEGSAVDAAEKLTQQIHNYREALEKEDAERKRKEQARERIEASTRDLAMEVGTRLGKIKVFGLQDVKADIAYFTNQQGTLKAKINELREICASIDPREGSHILGYAEGVLANIEGLLAYAQSNAEKLNKAQELGGIIKRIEDRWMKGDFPSQNEKDIVAQVNQTLKALQEELRQIIK